MRWGVYHSVKRVCVRVCLCRGCGRYSQSDTQIAPLRVTERETHKNSTCLTVGYYTHTATLYTYKQIATGKNRSALAYQYTPLIISHAHRHVHLKHCTYKHILACVWRRRSSWVCVMSLGRHTHTHWLMHSDHLLRSTHSHKCWSMNVWSFPANYPRAFLSH